MNKPIIYLFLGGIFITTILLWSSVRDTNNEKVTVSPQVSEINNYQNKVEIVNYAQSEKDCADTASKFESEENQNIGNTFPNNDDHNNFVIHSTNNFNKRDGKCYAYIEIYNRASYPNGGEFRPSHNADSFSHSYLWDAYEKTKIISCGTQPDYGGCIYWLMDSKEIGDPLDPNSDFNKKVKNYYMQN